MVTFDASNFHFEYMDVVRHWSPNSQQYAGGDVIVTLLNNGWQIGETVRYEEYWHAGSRMVMLPDAMSIFARRVMIYHLEMVRDDEVLRVPVLSNPYVRRLISNLPVQVRPIKEHAASVPQH